MEMTSLIIVGVVVLVAIITIIGILSRYRKCKSDELLVVYGKTGSHKEKVSERDAKGNLVDREVEIKTAKDKSPMRNLWIICCTQKTLRRMITKM